MRNVVILGTLVLFVALAGCAGGTGGDTGVAANGSVDVEAGDSPAESADPNDSATNDTPADAADDPDSETDAGGESDEAPDEAGGERERTEHESDVPARNPFGKEQLVVAINDSGVSMDTRHVVVDALHYWENNSEEYAGYPIAFDLRPSHPDPDVEIHFVEKIEQCGGEYDAVTVGCADYNVVRAPDTAAVAVEGGYTNATLVRVLKHELGHTLGQGHHNEPRDVMRPEQPAIVREVDVQLRIDSTYNDRTVRRNVETALDEWESYLADEGHEVEHSVEVVDEFDGTAEIAYDAGGSRHVCDGELVCLTNETADAEIKIETASIRHGDHEGIMGYYYGWYQRIPPDEGPPDYRADQD